MEDPPFLEFDPVFCAAMNELCSTAEYLEDLVWSVLDYV